MSEQRRDFLLPDFTRLIWHSEAARAVWAPRMNNINEAWMRIERWAVVERARDACLTFMMPSYLPEATAWAASHGLVLLPLARTGVSDQYSATPKPPQDNNWQYRCVLTTPERAKEWLEAWQDTGKGGKYNGTNNKAIGALLGYPQCCIDFFEREWVENKRVDTTWVMALGTAQKEIRGDTIKVTGPVEANILLRWLGVRLVAHLPCSFDCEHTVAMAKRFVDVGRKRHFGEWVDYIYEMLSWPAEWSALHGIAEIRTPVLTIRSRCDATANKVTVQRDGTAYPEEGARGLRFPYRIQTGNVTDKPSFKRSLLPVYELNGFGSEAFMNRAHDTLLETLPTQVGKILDLGCGNGRLLERAQAAGWQVLGVESDNVRAGAAKVPVRRGNLLDTTLWDDQFDVVVVMPGRLLERVPPEQADQFRTALKRRARAVLLYAYDDVLQKGGGLSQLALAAGLGDGEVKSVAKAPGVEAMLVAFTQAEASA